MTFSPVKLSLHKTEDFFSFLFSFFFFLFFFFWHLDGFWAIFPSSFQSLFPIWFDSRTKVNINRNGSWHFSSSRNNLSMRKSWDAIKSQPRSKWKISHGSAMWWCFPPRDLHSGATCKSHGLSFKWRTSRLIWRAKLARSRVSKAQMRQLVSLKQSKGRLAMAFRGSRQLQQHSIVLGTERNLRDPLV